MQDYKKMYFELAAKVADVIELLAEAQQRGEDDYITGADAVLAQGFSGREDRFSVPAEAMFHFGSGEMGTLRWTEV